MPVKIRLSPNGKQYYIEINHKGKSHTLTQWNNQKFYSVDVAEFVRGMILRQIEDENLQWDYWFPHLKKKFYFREAYWKWLDHKPIAPSTYYNRKHAYKHFLHMEKEDVRELRGSNFAWIREKYGDTPKAQALRRIAQAFLNWFHRAESTDKRIDLMPIVVPSHKTPYLPLEARWAIWDNMQDPYRDPMVMGIEMGMRIGEICALQWGDIDWDGDGINVCHTMSAYQLKDTRKGGDEVWLPMGEKSKEMLRWLRQSRQAIAGFVFTHSTGKQVWTQQLSAEFKRAVRVVGIPNAKFHHLRNSFLHDLSEAGATTKEAGALAGHKSERTTERYIGRWSKDKIREIASLRGKG